jgi:hypothetical protein
MRKIEKSFVVSYIWVFKVTNIFIIWFTWFISCYSYFISYYFENPHVRNYKNDFSIRLQNIFFK